MTSASYILVSAADVEPNKSQTHLAAGAAASSTATATAKASTASTASAQAQTTSKNTRAPLSIGLGLPSSLPFVLGLGPRKRTSSFSFSATNEPLRKYQKKMPVMNPTTSSTTTTVTTTTTKVATSTLTTKPTLTMVAEPQQPPASAPSGSGGLRRCASYASLNTLATYSPQASSGSTTTTATVTEVPYKRSLRYQLDQRDRRRAIAAKLTPGCPSMLTFPSSSSSSFSLPSSTSTSETEFDMNIPPAPPAPPAPALQDHAIPLKVKCKVSRKALPPIQIPSASRPAPPPPVSPISPNGPQPTPSIRHHSPPPAPCLPRARPLSPLCPADYFPRALNGPCSAFFATLPNARRPRGRPEANWAKLALCARLRASEEGRQILRVGPRRARAMGLLREETKEETRLTDFDRAWREGEALRASLGMCSASPPVDTGMDAAMGYEYGYGGGFDLTEATRELEELVRDQDRQSEEMGLFEMDVDEDEQQQMQVSFPESGLGSGIREEQLDLSLSSPYLSPAYAISSPSLTLAELNFAPASSGLTCPPSPALSFAAGDSFDASSDEEADKDAEGELDPDVFMFDAPAAAWPKSPKSSIAVTFTALSRHANPIPKPKSKSLGKRNQPVVHDEVVVEEEREGWNLVAYPFPSMGMTMAMGGFDVPATTTAGNGWEVIERSQAVLEACA